MKRRGRILWALTRGLLAAVGATLAGMLLLALAILYLGLGDRGLALLNQMLKILAIFVGVRLSVGLGGDHGFVKGAVLGGLYIALGTVSAVLLGGAAFSAPNLVLEVILGALVGAVFGMLFANLRKGRARVKPARRAT